MTSAPRAVAQANGTAAGVDGAFAVAWTMARSALGECKQLAGCETEDRDMTANRVCLPAIVAPTGVVLLRKSIQACVLIGVGDLSRQKFLVA